jgi:hypothetical protein
MNTLIEKLSIRRREESSDRRKEEKRKKEIEKKERKQLIVSAKIAKEYFENPEVQWLLEKTDGDVNIYYDNYRGNFVETVNVDHKRIEFEKHESSIKIKTYTLPCRLGKWIKTMEHIYKSKKKADEEESGWHQKRAVICDVAEPEKFKKYLEHELSRKY